jgi:hypothetical protein
MDNAKAHFNYALPIARDGAPIGRALAAHYSKMPADQGTRMLSAITRTSCLTGMPPRLTPQMPLAITNGWQLAGTRLLNTFIQ